MFTYKNDPYKIFALSPKFCWAGSADNRLTSKSCILRFKTSCLLISYNHTNSVYYISRIRLN